MQITLSMAQLRSGEVHQGKTEHSLKEGFKNKKKVENLNI